MTRTNFLTADTINDIRWYCPETIEHVRRIILTDTVNIEDCKMTERTVEQVNKEIQAEEKRIEARSFIAGPSYMKSIVSFDIRSDAGDYGDNAGDFEAWNKGMDAYYKGETPGEITVTIQTTSCDNDIRLDQELLDNIDGVKFEIAMDEQRKIMQLKQERTRLKDIEEKRHQLEWAEARNGFAKERKALVGFSL